MTIGNKRRLFTELIAELITFVFSNGYKVAFDKEHNKHMKNSLHYEGLAKDLLLYSSTGKYLTKTEDYTFLGVFWESLHPLCAWGGRFQDGNHFSIKHGGRK